jgi:hypothetical protein
MDYTLKALKSFSGLEFSYSPETGEITIHKGDANKDEVLLKAEEIKAAEPLRQLREQRTRIIQESDWMANSDVTMSDAWRTYRQALRDLPANSPNVALDEQGNLINVTWPTKPE